MASQDKLGDILKLNFKDIGCKSINGLQLYWSKPQIS